jgi:hypothetical protein
MMPNQSESEYRGWKIKISEVDNRPSPLIQVWKPGQDPREGGGDVVVPFIVHAVSRADAHVAALQAAKRWIDQREALHNEETR